MRHTAVAQATSTVAESKRTLGRPCGAGVDRAILTATLDLLSGEGYAGPSLEAAAARASVSKPAIYPRYRDKKALVVAAMGDMINASMPPVDTGNPRADVDPDIVIDMISGVAFQRHIAATDTSDTWVDNLLDLIWHGLTRNPT